MRIYIVVIYLCVVFGALQAQAQTPFVEGSITYHVTLKAPTHSLQGTYTIYVKGHQLRKEIELNNGFKDIVIYNYTNNTAYSLQQFEGNKYAIQLLLEDVRKRQLKYMDFKVIDGQSLDYSIVSLSALQGEIIYKDGTHYNMTYNKQWYPDLPQMYDRFPKAQFIPLCFANVEENGTIMQMDAIRFSVAPMEDALFKVPKDYGIMTHEEYKKLKK
jgi:hypothetical protein